MMYLFRLLLNKLGLYSISKFDFIKFMSSIHEKVMNEILEKEEVIDELKGPVSFEINVLLLCYEEPVLKAGLSHIKPFGLSDAEDASNFHEEVVDQLSRCEVMGRLHGRKIMNVNGEGVSGFDLLAERKEYHMKNLQDITHSYLRNLDIMLFSEPLVSIDKIRAKAKLSLDFHANSKRESRLRQHLDMINRCMIILKQEIKFVEP